MYTIPKFWLGSQDTLQAVLAADEQVRELQMRGGMDGMSMDSLYTLQDGVGVISIKGSLIQGSAGWMRFFGVTGYEDIRAAVAEALEDKNAKSIMLHVESGGGSVAGCEDLGQFLKLASTIKPLTTYADGIMASAAYWLGSYGKTIMTNRTSMLGSLGVLVIHAERSEMLKADGVKVTVMRAGKYKALGNPYEPLTNLAKDEIQAQLDTIYDVFTSTVAENRGRDQAYVDKNMAQGRDFLGVAAQKVGLADVLLTYEQAHAYTKALDKGVSSSNNSRNSKGAKAMKVTLNASQLAAFTAGATLQSLGFPADAEVEASAETKPVVKTEAELQAEAQAETARQAALAAETPEAKALREKAEADAKTAAASPTAEVTGLNAQITLLTSQLAAAQTAQVAAQAQVATLTAQLTATKEASDGLVAIAREATGTMLVALGNSRDGVAAMDGPALVAENKRVGEIFKSKFKVGGVAATTVPEKKAEAPAQMDRMMSAALSSGPQARRAAAEAARTK